MNTDDEARRTQHRPSSIEQLRAAAADMRMQGFSENTIATAMNLSVEFVRSHLPRWLRGQAAGVKFYPFNIGDYMRDTAQLYAREAP